MRQQGNGLWWRVAALSVVALIVVSCASSQSQTTTSSAKSQSQTTTSSANTTAPVDAEETNDPPSPPPTRRSSIPHGVIQQIECDDNAACAAEFRLNGRIYSESCALIDPSQVDLGNELGMGWAFNREVRAHALLLDESHGIIAISAMPGSTGCRENPGPDAPTSPWQFAFGSLGSVDTSLICIVRLSTPEEAAEDCDQ